MILKLITAEEVILFFLCPFLFVQFGGVISFLINGKEARRISAPLPLELQALISKDDGGDEIPAALYQAVAEILAAIYREAAERRRRRRL